MVLEAEDQGSRPSSRPKTPDLACHSSRYRAFMAGHSIRPRGEVEVSVVVMAVVRLRPSLRISTMEEVCTHTDTQLVFNHQRQNSMNKYMTIVELHRSDKNKQTKKIHESQKLEEITINKKTTTKNRHR